MRVLIVGGGVAGLTLAARLRQQGREPVVVEQGESYRDEGYAIGLYPLGSCVFHGLGVYEEFLARGVVSQRYEALDGSGRLLQAMDMSVLTGRVGPMVMLARSDLVDVLRTACGGLQVRMGVTVRSIAERDGAVAVELSDGGRDAYDLVVGCDGIHSRVRELALGPQPTFDTGWALWTWWAEAGRFSPEVVQEHWGAGWLFGVYPAPGRTMCVLGLPEHAPADAGATDRHAPDRQPDLRDVLARLAARDDRVAGAIDDAGALFHWPMVDVRSREWRRGRVVLCGDAATAFLPTAGVGASNAMRAAAALADELSRADAATVPLALELYEKRTRELVEGNQDESRRVARLMFVRNRWLAAGRDVLLRHYPAERILEQIIGSMRTPF